MRRVQKNRQFGIMAALKRLGLVRKKKALPVARPAEEEEVYDKAPLEETLAAEQYAPEPADEVVAQQSAALEPPSLRQPAAESLRAFIEVVKTAPPEVAAPGPIASTGDPPTDFSIARAAEQLLARRRRAAASPPHEAEPSPGPVSGAAPAPPAGGTPTSPPPASPKAEPPAIPVQLARKLPSGGSPPRPELPSSPNPHAHPAEGAEAEVSRHWLNRYWRKAGAGSLALSIGVHVVGILIAILIVSTTASRQTVDFLPGGGSKGAGEATSEIAHQVQSKRRRTLDAPKQRVVSNSSSSVVKLPDLPLDRPEMPPVSNLLMSNNAMGFGQSGAGGGFGNGVGMGGQNGFTSLPPMLRSRCGDLERLSKLKETGGSVESEAAVGRALQWLKARQNPDGSWGQTYKCAMTGFALLCYLGHCETPDSPAYGHQVMQGLLYLMETQRANRFGIFSTAPASNASTYEHGICTYAFGEMYTLSRLGSRQLPGMREAFQDGVKVIINNQMSNGSWSYGLGRGIGYDRDSRESDLSVTGWQYQALKSARYTSLPFQNLNIAIDRTVKYLESTQTPDGGFGVREHAQNYNQFNLTGTAVLGLQTLGHGKNAAIDKGVKFAVNYFAGDPPRWSRNANLYCWYYYSQAFFQYGGAVWKGWNDRLLPELLEHQAKDGSWNEEVFDSDLGSTSVAMGDNEIYRAALCTLMLEVYYRYLKVGDRDASSMFSR